MSESIVRKIQPFTIRTKLSAPAMSRCTDNPENFLPRQMIPENLNPKHLNDQVSFFLNQKEEEITAGSMSTASRSIHKITISSHREGAQSAKTENININNNNNIKSSSSLLPKVMAVSSEKKPNSHFKVLLCKNGGQKCNGDQENYSSSPQISHFSQCEGNGDEEGKPPVLLQKDGSQIFPTLSKSKQSAQSCEDVCAATRVSLMQYDESIDHKQTLFNHQISQTEEKQESDEGKRQLIQARDQWSLLRVTAANQIRVVGGAKGLQEFNSKVERLEAWIKEKEHEASLEINLDGNTDKMHITRKILDLKQDEQNYGHLHEDINLLALWLEKQGKAEAKGISARRKHVNKMWLKAQSQLKDYHAYLQQALEVSSFFDQAECIYCSISNMKKSTIAGLGTRIDGEIRDIASKIMEMDVSVSQLSNLQPSLVSQITKKQVELKDYWASLQETLRNKKGRRESNDPGAPSPHLVSVGTDLQSIMGKEGKEEEIHLKGFMLVKDVQCSTNPSNGKDLGANEAQISERGNTARVECTSHSVIYTKLHTQLQKFTVSADKTLSWLKESVALAAQICSSSQPNSFDSTKRRQASLEQEILCNRARIELVKREGHSLVRAHHPESLKIQEFLTQLERLWDELKRRNQRNTLLLKLSEELGDRVVCVLQSLCALEAWLHAVQVSLTHSSVIGEDVSVRDAEKRSNHLEKELEIRSLELQQLRLQADTLSRHTLLHLSRHTHLQLSPNTLLQAQTLPARLQEVEDKLGSVQTALRQQRSELKDTQMLTEFLEKLEMEESHYSSPTQPLCRELDSGSSLHDEPLMIENPVQELREAVEMLNDTERERGRSQSREQSVQELLDRHAVVHVCVERCIRRSADLALDVLKMESEMVIRCELDQTGLEQLRVNQDQLEAEFAVIKSEMETLQSLWSRLTLECPERTKLLQSQIEPTLMLWLQLETGVSENRSRLLQFTHLRGFFRRYLDMISWTEETRWWIFSDAALRADQGTQLLDEQIQQKFEEFDRLVTDGNKVSGHQHHLSHMIGERLEELRSMLGWIRLHWGTQKDQLLNKQKSEEAQTDNIYCEAKDCSTQILNESTTAVSTEPLSPAPPADMEDDSPLSYEYEIMKSVSPKGSDGRESPYLTLKEPVSSSPGGSVSLILSFRNSTEKQIQAQEPNQGNGGSQSEPVHRVSAYLHVTENTMVVPPVYEIMSPSKDNAQNSSSSTPRNLTNAYASPRTSPCFSSSPEDTNHSSVQFLPKRANISIFNSLKRRSKKVNRSKDDCRHGVRIKYKEHLENTVLSPVDESVIYDTHTWPLKEWRKSKNAQKSNENENQVLDYSKNQLIKHIDAEFSGSPVKNILENPTQVHAKNHCRFLSLGSVLSFDLPKDMSLIPSIQDVITIVPPEHKNQDSCVQEPQLDRPKSLSTFKIPRCPPQIEEPKEFTFEINTKDPRMISSDSISFTGDDFPPPPSPVIENISFEEKHPSSLNYQADIKQKHTCETGIVSKVSIVSNQNDKYETQYESTQEEEKQGQMSNVSSVTEIQVCPSIDTLQSSCTQESSLNSLSNILSNFQANAREDSIDSGHSSSGSFKLCPEDSNIDTLESPKVYNNPSVKELSSMNVKISNRSFEFSRDETLSLSLDVDDHVHPDHQQFEQEEEELEDIWSQNKSYRQSFNSDIMYDSYQAMLINSSPHHQRENSPKEQNTLFKTMITASAPNLHVAEFNLPPSVQPTVGFGKRVDEQNLGKEDGKIWSAFTLQDQSHREKANNETVSGLLKLPEIQDQEKYIYQYGETEDEEEEDGFVKDQSMCLLSVQPGLEDTRDTEIQNRGQDVALPSMEGTLERKHKLQLGGKKAPCRTWSSYYAVLYKHTMLFHQERKETLKSYVHSLPLNLIGAACEPCPEYTKKPNCFSLRLRDGSEYLLRSVCPSSSSSVMLSRHSPAPCICSCSDSCSCSSWDSPSELQQSFPSLLQPAHQRHEWGQLRLKPVISTSPSQERTTEKRRSLSFTAATYQKVRPVMPPAGRSETSGSSYTVTLLIPDRETAIMSKNPADSHNLPSRSFFSLPRPTSKPGFRKIFRKKE
ncbi:hypothetical protein DNTS_021106 [Danionella cerebrum]|uniref:Pleckstrin homology domain-containing protein n=1 Tax=Danionella cerebrum TaxID=2873325 RepID=A0A553QT40_9TELE|nr:hypothetical protein DNTS_021106 [Danionella translucida]TRY93139.1 hypothetical protein DNTS_021106 [Danionella translucida]TRY93140.1 hypothetical protein DNTS_021106 [Danionella translucida]